MGTLLKEQAAEKIKELYEISAELERLFPGRHYTPDGHMIGSIGEALAASYYGLELFPASEETHDAKSPDGRLVQIKATQINRISMSSEPRWLLVLRIHRDGTFSEEYNGPPSEANPMSDFADNSPGRLAWEHCGKMQKNGQRSISLAKLRKLQAEVPDSVRLPRTM
mgnify:FL=1